MYSLGPIRTLLASFLFCDRPIAEDVRGSGNTVPSSTSRVGSVAAEQSYRACGSSYLVPRTPVPNRGTALALYPYAGVHLPNHWGGGGGGGGA